MHQTFHTQLEFLKAFRELGRDMPIQMAVVFLNVANAEGISMTELYKSSGISQASCSRNVAALSKLHRLDKPGLDLVFTKEDPQERRRKIVFLTPKGKLLAEKISKL
mgnify:CR=1 FL=1